MEPESPESISVTELLMSVKAGIRWYGLLLMAFNNIRKQAIQIIRRNFQIALAVLE